jgi:hypothetical protein
LQITASEPDRVGACRAGRRAVEVVESKTRGRVGGHSDSHIPCAIPHPSIPRASTFHACHTSHIHSIHPSVLLVPFSSNTFVLVAGYVVYSTLSAPLEHLKTIFEKARIETCNYQAKKPRKQYQNLVEVRTPRTKEIRRL